MLLVLQRAFRVLQITPERARLGALQHSKSWKRTVAIQDISKVQLRTPDTLEYARSNRVRRIQRLQQNRKEDSHIVSLGHSPVVSACGASAVADAAFVLALARVFCAGDSATGA